ncbi:MAG: hypothetical protein S4CHLAM7_04730 [Chlamydiae bacterium]|nr:hypothetical protein [Chlamydiota bacterium]
MERQHFSGLIQRYLKSHPVVAILGPRQCGKTTLAREYCEKTASFPKSNYFDLESPIDLERIQNPMLTLTKLSGLIVIDEVQRFPDLFTILRVLVDNQKLNQKYLILGSASKELLRQSSESLAGRVAYLELTPFNLAEVRDLEKLWVQGGFPKSYLAETEEASLDWRNFYIRALLERDIPSLGFQIPPDTMQRFWSMLAHYHGNIFNASELGRSFGVSGLTIRKYLDILTGIFMVRQLQPWHVNLGKRQVKSPKIYFRDSGLLHSLLRVRNKSELFIHPKLGASWEGFALEEVVRSQKEVNQDCYFWSTHGGAEIDLLLPLKEGLIGVEFKYSDAPRMTKSMQIALQDLKLKHLYVIYPGEVDYPLSEQVTVKSLSNYLSDVAR